ncbi:hypothetical protein [Flavobacterium daemonense]|uniref:hypothetical protein n=1 Tax=Flavobacterium daemonense TaxID=1393049 RepID=UPI0011855B27|nr:hypothetical protein [Flavobacterium daemonense]KAF2336363.1 hypothetical protein FND99_03525 [Flavobacterium daemonense]
MDSEELKVMKLSIMVLSFKIKALQDCLTSDQKRVFESSLEESKNMIRGKLENSLNPEEFDRLFEALDAV